MFVSLAIVNKRFEQKTPKEILEEKRAAKKEAARARSRNSNYAERKAHNLNWKRFPFPFNLFVMFSWACDYLAQSSLFNNYILLCIGVAGLMVGLQTYPSFQDNSTLAMLDTIILYSFSSEVVLKILSDGFEPYMYFVGPEWSWNWFDFFIVVFSLPFIPFAAGQIKLLRLIRLMRLAKVFRKIPQLQMIIMGIIGGMKSCIYIVLLMIITFYLFAIMGVLFLKENDPWTFHSIEIAMLNLLRISTLDGWGDLFYISYYGCDVYPGNYFTNDPAEASDKLGGLMHCKTPVANPVIATCYFILIIFLSAFCIVSLFIGAISMAMAENMMAMKREKEALNDEKDRDKIDRFLLEYSNPAKLDRKMLRKIELVKNAFMGNPMVDVHASADAHGLKQAYLSFCYACQDLADYPPFQQYVTGIILLAGVLVGLGTVDKYRIMWDEEIALLGEVVQYTFTFEVVLKIFAEETRPWRYFLDSWNVFDFIVVAASFLPIGGGSAITILRLLRLLRVLKLMRALKQLQVIVSALMSGISSIGFIFCILLLAYYFFSIVAMTLFGSNDKWHFETLHMAMVTLFDSATLDGWSDIMWINMYGCGQFPGNYPELCTHDHPQFIMSALFWITFTIFGSFVLLTLFIGVVGMGMEEAKRDQSDEAKVIRKAEVVAQKESLAPETVALYREVFDIVDLGQSNRIGRDEMNFGLKLSDIILLPEEFEDLWGKVDRDGSNSIDFSEFLILMIDLSAQFSNVVDPVSGKKLRKRNTYSFGNSRTSKDEDDKDGTLATVTVLDSISEGPNEQNADGDWKAASPVKPSKSDEQGKIDEEKGLDRFRDEFISEGDDLGSKAPDITKPLSAKASTNLMTGQYDSTIRDMMSPQRDHFGLGTLPHGPLGMFPSSPFAWPPSVNPETDVNAAQMQQMQMMMMPFLHMMSQHMSAKKEGAQDTLGKSGHDLNPFIPMLAMSKSTSSLQVGSSLGSPDKDDLSNTVTTKLKRKPVKSKVMSI